MFPDSLSFSVLHADIEKLREPGEEANHFPQFLKGCRILRDAEFLEEILWYMKFQTEPIIRSLACKRLSSKGTSSILQPPRYTTYTMLTLKEFQDSVPNNSVSQVPFSIPVMLIIIQEESFGPLLPVVTVESLDEGINFVNERDKPLAFYVFTESTSTFRRINKLTSAGSVCHNDTIMQAGGVCVDVIERGRGKGRERDLL